MKNNTIDNIINITLTASEAKMIKTALYQHWINMTDDNGDAINCKPESVECTYELFKNFENLLTSLDD